MALVLRDIVIMMMMVCSIFVLTGIFVTDMASNYGNTEMADEWALTDTNSLGSDTFYDTGTDVEEVGDGLGSTETGVWSLIAGAGNTLKGIGKALVMVLTAPNTIGNLLYGTLLDAGVATGVSGIIKYLVITILWIIVIFTIASGFLRGPRL